MKLSTRGAAAVLVAIVLGFGIFMGARTVTAETEDQGPRFSTTKTITDNLLVFRGSAATLHLASGTTISGKIEAVDNGLIHVSQITGKEFYDALVRVDSVIALEARARK